MADQGAQPVRRAERFAALWQGVRRWKGKPPSDHVTWHRDCSSRVACPLERADTGKGGNGDEAKDECEGWSAACCLGEIVGHLSDFKKGGNGDEAENECEGWSGRRMRHFSLRRERKDEAEDECKGWCCTGAMP